MQTRISALGEEPECRRRAAARLVIETLLVQELGGALAGEATFQAVIDEVLEAIEETPALRADMEQVVGGLLALR